LPAALVARLGVQMAQARARPAGPRRLELQGALTVAPDRLFRVGSRFPGEVIELVPLGDTRRPPRVGDRVTIGQLLAVVWSRDLAQKKSELLDALLKLHLDEEHLRRVEEMAARGLVPEATLRQQHATVAADKTAAARAELTLLTWRLPEAEIKAIKDEARRLADPKNRRDLNREKEWARVEVPAPADGIVVEKYVAAGHVVETNTDLYKIADLSELAVVAYAPLEDTPTLMQLLSARQRAWTIRDRTDPEAPAVEGTFERIVTPVADAAGRERVEVRGRVPNSQGRLLPGRSVTATILLPAPAAEVVVPRTALVEEDGGTFVFVQADPEQPVFTQRRVAVMRRGGDLVHLRAGAVRPGERIVTGGAVELQAALDDLRGRR
jgi:cobalt-zinc-cadmium efflux system membrane fusion protein